MSGKAKNHPLIEANAELQSEFNRIRHRYWISKGKDIPELGEVTVSYCSILDGAYGYLHRIRGQREFSLVVCYSLRYDPDELRRTLLHEMAHLYVRKNSDKGNGGHGLKWRREIARLVTLGAYGDTI